ncbi:guanine nucleotide binding protein, alpha subunit [Jimgerdemannia flammicorona]|uniref:Guanine nucleotide binding protein, alpha subunit n=1 Tax=Jimgerdemannia flammicorona TaxID=994334 RepID=A0A432ZYN4_9FUNG|nr:guanine nucleotide binding protein, alpha subunit [Jimgerdemannia flammicorona]
MGLCLSAEEREGRERSNQIDRFLDEDNKKFKKECKILLLGSGESGKSTIVKQMKIMYQNGYSPQELFSWRLTVYKNSLESAQALIAARHKLDVKWTNKDNIEYAQRILQYHISNELSFRLSQDIVHAIDSIWRDPAIQEVVERGGSEYYLMDSAP